MASIESTRVVVVGNGMVSHRFCERLAQYDTSRRFHVTVLGEEPRPAYDRVHLTDYLARPDGDHLQLGTRESYAKLGIELRIGTKVTHIDRDARSVLTDGGESLPWDVLVLATGSSPFVPSVAG